MSSGAIIEEIKQLTPDEQVEVIQFVIQLAKARPLTANELTELARQMVESEDPAEVQRLKTAISHGFYGNSAHA
ncbi:MAG TPA: hypothetical protein VGH19_05725 [Verrucomicrobiae bacterium]